MSQRTTFSTTTPLPRGISRQTVISFLHDHKRMIDLNPLVKERHTIRRPLHAAPDELRCTWYSITDHASYLPGKIATGEVTYTCAFNNLPNGLQSHCYAPAGLDIRQRWLIDEPVQAVVLGLKGVSAKGLYIREEVEILCNMAMTTSAKNTLKDLHAELVARLKLQAQPMSSSARAVIHTNTKTLGIITSTGQDQTGNNIRGVKAGGAADTAADRGKHLAVYSWLKSHEQRQPQPQHSRSSSDRSTNSSGSSNSQNSSLPSPVSSYASTPSYRNMVVSPPTPPFTPMASPSWRQLQSPPQTTVTTLASLSPGKVPPKRPPRPEEREKEMLKQRNRLIPEPLRIPRTTGAAAVAQSYSPVNINAGPRQIVGFQVGPSISPIVAVSVNGGETKTCNNNNNNIDTGLGPRRVVLEDNIPKIPPKLKSPTSRRRKFSYDSTSSTEDHLVTSPTVILNKKLPSPPPQHILSQSRDYNEQVVTKDSSPPPSSPILERLRKYMGTQHISSDPFEPHPDYPHMSPYMDDDGHLLDSYQNGDDDDEYEDIYYYNESDKLAVDDSDDAVGREIKFLGGLIKGDTLDDYYLCYAGDMQQEPPVKKKPGKEAAEEKSLVMNDDDDDSGYADHVPPPPPQPTSKAPLPPPVAVVEEKQEVNQMTGATLSGPFVAAFDEFNICLP